MRLYVMQRRLRLINSRHWDGLFDLPSGGPPSVVPINVGEFVTVFTYFNSTLRINYPGRLKSLSTYGSRYASTEASSEVMSKN